MGRLKELRRYVDTEINRMEDKEKEQERYDRLCKEFEM